jgi:colanic acid biosynthesis glycosyl transferase WcaI
MDLRPRLVANKATVPSKRPVVGKTRLSPQTPQSSLKPRFLTVGTFRPSITHEDMMDLFRLLTRAQMPRLIFVNRFFFPDHSATSQILSDLAQHLANAGRDVHVVTSTQIYDDAKAALPVSEIIAGVHVHRVPSTGFGRDTLPGRSIDYVSFYWSMWQCLVALARPGDIIVAKTDPPLTSIVAMAAARRQSARLVNWLQDIYPETAVALGVPFLRGPLAASLIALRNRSLRQAEATVVVGDLMAQKVESLGAPPSRVHVITNWCHDEEIRPVARSENPLRQRWGLADQFVLGYSGNLGRAHEFETVLTTAERLRNEPHFMFLMIGGGKRFEELAQAVKGRDLARSFRFIPYQEQKLLPCSLAVADAHWLSLNPKLEGLIVPSKFYAIAAAGKPIIVIADKNGEIARLVQQHCCGIVVAPGDADALVDGLRRLSSAPEMTSEMGRRARAMLDAHFTRQQALQLWSGLFEHFDKSSASDNHSKDSAAAAR